MKPAIVLLWVLTTCTCSSTVPDLATLPSKIHASSVQDSADHFLSSTSLVPPSHARYYPQYHLRPHLHADGTGKNCNDPNGPFWDARHGLFHLFQQAQQCGGGFCAVGWAHYVSENLATWIEVEPTLVPGHATWLPNATRGYWSGSVTVIDGEPRLVVPSVFGPRNTSECWVPAKGPGPPPYPWPEPWSNASNCNIDYQVFTPQNLSDIYLRQWGEPTTLVSWKQGPQPHSWVMQDPSHAWRDPLDANRWLFIGETWLRGENGPLLELWGSKNGSNWDAGFEYVGPFFPATGDDRCPGNPSTTNCAECCPELIEFDQNISVLYGCSNKYWIGKYVVEHTSRTNKGSLSSTVSGNSTSIKISPQRFVPTTNALELSDHPATSAGKGFMHEDGRYLWWAWIHGDADRKAGFNWNSMLTVPQVLSLDRARQRVSVFPAKEVELLRKMVLANISGTMDTATQQRAIDGITGCTLDIEVSYTWPLLPAIPTSPRVGLSVLVGGSEQTQIWVEEYQPTLTTFMQGTDIPCTQGCHEKDFPATNYTDPHECQRLCETRSKDCKAWTFVPPPNINPRCCIKSGTWPLKATPSSSCTSGILDPPSDPLASEALTLVLDRCHSSANPAFIDSTCRSETTLIVGAGLRRDTDLNLRILVDNSVVAVYVQGGAAMRLGRVYPTTSCESLGLRLLHNSTARTKKEKPANYTYSVQVWQMGSAWQVDGFYRGHQTFLI